MEYYCKTEIEEAVEELLANLFPDEIYNSVKEQAKDSQQLETNNHAMDVDQTEGEAEIEYIVEKIVDKKIGEGGRALYYIKWQNYGHKENSWEPLENLVGCERAIERFELNETEKAVERRRKEKLDQKVGEDKTVPSEKKNRPYKPMPKSCVKNLDYEVEEILGLTKIQEEKFFLVSLAGGAGTAFIKALIANVLMPSNVIDFYIKHLVWKES